MLGTLHLFVALSLWVLLAFVGLPPGGLVVWCCLVVVVAAAAAAAVVRVVRV